MLIGKVAELAQTPPSTIRFYEKAGVLPEPERDPSGYRDYDASVLRVLDFIKSGQSLGLTLGELREIIGFRERGEVPCDHVIGLIRKRAGEIATKIEQMRQMQSDLESLCARAEHLDPADCSSECICHVIVGPDRRPDSRLGRV